MKLANATKLHSKSRDVGHPWFRGGAKSQRFHLILGRVKPQRLSLLLGGEISRNHCLFGDKERFKNQFLFRGEKNPKHG